MTETHNDADALKKAAEKKKETTITAASFDRQVADKLGAFFGDVFLPAMKAFLDAGLSYDDVTRMVKISPCGERRSAGRSSRTAGIRGGTVGKAGPPSPSL